MRLRTVVSVGAAPINTEVDPTACSIVSSAHQFDALLRVRPTDDLIGSTWDHINPGDMTAAAMTSTVVEVIAQRSTENLQPGDAVTAVVYGGPNRAFNFDPQYFVVDGAPQLVGLIYANYAGIEARQEYVPFILAGDGLIDFGGATSLGAACLNNDFAAVAHLVGRRPDPSLLADLIAQIDLREGCANGTCGVVDLAVFLLHLMSTQPVDRTSPHLGPNAAVVDQFRGTRAAPDRPSVTGKVLGYRLSGS